MTTALAILGLCGLGWTLLRVNRWRQQRAVNRIIRESLNEWEQRRRCFTVRDGDGIQPLRRRY
ncbi:MAG TPA: hypothetical protein VK504_18770 [Vicinamibacterales bacterium]|nr:hypothetical protein [Vicinamibacterales bacterium]